MHVTQQFPYFATFLCRSTFYKLCHIFMLRNFNILLNMFMTCDIFLVAQHFSWRAILFISRIIDLKSNKFYDVQHFKHLRYFRVALHFSFRATFFNAAQHFLMSHPNSMPCNIFHIRPHFLCCATFFMLCNLFLPFVTYYMSRNIFRPRVAHSFLMSRNVFI